MLCQGFNERAIGCLGSNRSLHFSVTRRRRQTAPASYGTGECSQRCVTSWFICFWFFLINSNFIFLNRKNHSVIFPTSTESITSVNLIRFLLYHLYIDDNVNEPWCKQTNNSFLTMLSSTYIDFSQLSYLVKSFSWMFFFLLLHKNKDANYFSSFFSFI